MIYEEVINSLLKNISSAMGQQLASGEGLAKICESLCTNLQADDWILYMQRQDRMVIVERSDLPVQRMTVFIENNNVPAQVSYLKGENLKILFPASLWERCLLLPVWTKDKMLGVWVGGWKQHFPIEQWTENQIKTLQFIGHLIGSFFASQEEIQYLKSRENTLERICRQAMDELENNKRQLSRELHDEVGQAMTSILLQLKLLQHEQDIEVIHARLGGLRYIAQQTVEDVRRLSMNLRPSVLENLGLIAALEWYIREYIKYSGVKVDFSSRCPAQRFSEEIEIVVYRAVQESLTNVIRHAEANEVKIRLTPDENSLQLQIEDNGRGMDVQDTGSGLGLLGMEERVKHAGGVFQLKSKPGKGMEITINLPLVYKGE